MAANRQTLLLLVLAVVAGVGGYVWLQPMAGPSSAEATPREEASRPALAERPAAASTASDVDLESLTAIRPTPGAVDRNLFRFKPKPEPRPEPVARVMPPTPAGPPPPPPVPPIGLKFIGLLEPSPSIRIAILSDGRGAPIYGREGESVLGQYRILQITADSIDMVYLDGKGRQRIRLSGS